MKTLQDIIANPLPLSIRDISPHPDAIRLTGQRADGLPNGIHTGGAWLWQGEVWKPLDGRPYPNSANHYATQEDDVLELMVGQPLFPHNWRIEERNGRRFLVRKKALILPDDADYDDLDREHLLAIEKAVRNLNRQQWELGDDIALAFDINLGELFFYDLSAAHIQDGEGCYQADDTQHIYRFFGLCKQAAWLLKLRQNAEHAISYAYHMKDRVAGYQHVYASFARPISLLWATFPETPLLRHNDYADWSAAVPLTWVITKDLLPESILYSYELIWGWSPIHYS